MANVSEYRDKSQDSSQGQKSSVTLQGLNLKQVNNNGVSTIKLSQVSQSSVFMNKLKEEKRIKDQNRKLASVLLNVKSAYDFQGYQNHYEK